MSHKVIEIKGEMWDYIINHKALSEIWHGMIAKYVNSGKTIVRKNFGEKKSIEIVGIEEGDLLTLQCLEGIIYEQKLPPRLIKIKQY
jgi:hypothetical protein